MNNAHREYYFFSMAALGARNPLQSAPATAGLTPNMTNRMPQELSQELQQHACRSSPRLSHRSPDLDQIDRTARPVIVENPDGQPPGSPGGRVEIGAALVQERAVRIIVVAVHDVEFTKAVRLPLRIALPQQRGFALLV